MPRYDIYALSEVDPKNFTLYKKSMGSNFYANLSSTGGVDRLLFLINRDRFKTIDIEELHTLNDANHRSPLVVELFDQTAGKHFKITVSHFARGDARLREEQANGLREWARAQTVPTIAVGDFNLDYDFIKHEGNAAFAAIMRDGVFKWIKPEEWIDTNWSSAKGVNVDRYPDSMLDFAFVAGPAKEWDCECRVIVMPGDFPDNEESSDHRPVELVVAP